MRRFLAQRRDIHLVMGTSSAGKSSFIQSQLERGRWRPSMPVWMAYELEDEAERLPRKSCVIHYNLLRPVQQRPPDLGRELTSDAVLARLLKEPSRLLVDFLIAPRSTLAKRTLLRPDVEPELRQETARGTYPAAEIFELLCRLDMRAFYRSWFELLDSYEIPYRVFESSDRQWRRLESQEEALEFACSGSQESYSESEIAAILKRFRFEYQGIDLPSRHRTTGDDRSASMELIFAEDLAGKTVLDVGCAYGYFCFEAERRGASRVTGTELKTHRFVGANVLREILGSDVRILKQDIFAEGAEEEYDVVLLLNVLHHLPEPIKALRTLGRLCREKLIIEFPTLLDPKYGGTLGDVLPEEVNDLPLIGVSLPAECDQYFLFTEAAIRRVLSDQVGGFAEIEIWPSPMAPDRRIAVCRRSCGKRAAAEEEGRGLNGGSSPLF